MIVSPQPMPDKALLQSPSPPSFTEAGDTSPHGDDAQAKLILYRPNVAAVLVNEEGYMLIAERSNIRGSWQFPQGGVDPGEGLEEALYREIEEEIGVRPELIKLLQRKGGFRYDFPKGRLKYGIYGGQEQVYYLCRFLGKDKDINLDTDHREFGRWRWIKPEKFDMDWVPKFKRHVYRGILREFFGIEK